MFDAEQDEWKRLPHCASPRVYSAMALLPIVNDTHGNDIVRAVLYGGRESSSSVITVSLIVTVCMVTCGTVTAYNKLI